MALIGNSAALLFKIDADSSGVKREFAAVDGSITSLGGKMSSFGGIATIAAAGITAIGAAAVTTSQYIFDLTKAASDYGSAIYDAGQKTGLSAETLSSFQVAAEQSGTTLDAVTAGIAKFAKNYKGTLDELEPALAKVFKQIADAKPGFEQLTLAQQNFGKSGANLLPFIKSFDGDLPGLIAKMKDLGVTMSDQNAKAADEFGDTLDTLKSQAAGVGRQFAFALMPAITNAMRAISGVMTNNQSAVHVWGSSVGEAVRGVSTVFQFLDGNVQLAFRSINYLFGVNMKATVNWAQFIFDTALPVLKILREIASVGGGVSDSISTATETASGIVTRQAGVRMPDMPTLRGGRSGKSGESAADKAAREAEQRARRDAVAEMQGAVNNLRRYQEELTAEIDKSLESYEGLGRTDDLYAQVGREIERITNNITIQITEIERLEDKNRATNTEQENLLLTQEQSLRRERLGLDLKKESARLAEDVADKDKKAMAEAGERIERAIKQLEREIELLEEKQRLMEELRPDALFDPTTLDGAQPNGDGQAGVSPYGPFQSWIDGWTQFVAQVEADAPTLGQTLQGLQGIFINAFQGMAQAMGGVVQQWVLMGSTGPAVMRKILASALASIAAEAAVRAIWELALGFATLFTNPSESAGHFIAAALFGTVAVGAGLAGRAIAGDAFKQQAQASTGSSSSSTANSGQGSAGKAGVYSSQEDMTVDRSRNSPMGRIAVELMVKGKDAFADMFAFEISKNGKLRAAIQDAAAA